MSQNITLYNLRNSLGLSRFALAKKDMIPYDFIYLHENGYIHILKKHLMKFSAFFNVDPTVFNDDLGYTTPLYKEPSDGKFKAKAKKKILSLPSIIINVSLFFVSLGTMVYGQTLYKKSNTNVYQYYDSTFLNVLDSLKGNGEYVELLDAYSYTYKDEAGNNFEITTSSDKNNCNNTTYKVSLIDGDSTIDLTFLESKNAEPTFYYTNINLEEFSLDTLGLDSLTIGVGGYYNEKFELQHLYRNSVNAIHGTELTNLNAKIAAATPTINSLFKSTLSSIEATYDGSFIDFLNLQLKGSKIIHGYKSLGTQLITYATFSAAIFAFFSILLPISRYYVKKKYKFEDVPLEENPSAMDLEMKSHKKPLKKNMPNILFIPETLIRLVVVGLVIYSSTLLFQVALKVSLSTTISQTILSLIGLAEYIKTVPYVPLATLLWFFIRLEMLHHTKYLIRQIVMFFFFGVLYYIFENMGGFLFGGLGDTYRQVLFIIFQTVLPGNLPWGIACFSLIVLFLSTTPKNLKYKKGGVIWRCLVILPISYLVGSYLYSVGTSLWGWEKLPTYLEALLYRKQFLTMSFAILYPFTIWLYRKIVRKKFGILNAKKYVHGNKYFLIKNICTCTIILALALVGFLMKDNSLAKTLDMNKGYNIAYLIPLILFYHPHMGKRNPIIDGSFAIGYGFGLSFAYIYIAQIVLLFDLYLPLVFPYMF